MDHDAAYSDLIAKAAALGLEGRPDLQALDERIAADKALVDEAMASGKWSKAARTAKRRLQNPGFVSTHTNVTRERLQKTADDAEKAEVEAAKELLTRRLISEQAKLEVQRFDARRGAANFVPQSREDTSAAGYNIRFLRPIISHLKAHGVSRSAFQRAPGWVLSTCAMIVGWAHRDPEFEDPRNPVRSLWKAGIVEAGNPSMTSAEAQAIDAAVAAGEQDELALIKRIYGLQPDPDQPLSASFLMGCMRLAERAEELSEYESDTVWEARNRIRSAEVAVVARLLGLDEGQTEKVSEVVRFLKVKAIDFRLQMLLQDHTVFIIREVIDKERADVSDPADWVPSVTEKLIEIAERCAPMFSCEEAFFGYVHACFEHSLAKFNLAEAASVRTINERQQAIHRSVEVALDSGHPFKFNRAGFAISEDDPEFHFIAQQPMTKDTYWGSRGPASPHLDQAAELDRAEDHAKSLPIETGTGTGETIAFEGAESEDPHPVLTTVRSMDAHADSDGEARSEGYEETELDSDDEAVDAYDWHDENPDLGSLKFDLDEALRAAGSVVESSGDRSSIGDANDAEQPTTTADRDRLERPGSSENDTPTPMHPRREPTPHGDHKDDWDD